MRRLTLIRHGLTEGNVRRLYYGALDLPLCETGKSALREAAAGGLYPPYSGERVLTSGMLRTEQTLRLIYGEVLHESWADLREVRFGIFEGKSYNELKGQPDYEAWLAGDWFRNVPPGGESFAQAETRILSALNRMQAQNADILAVVHGGIQCSRSCRRCSRRRKRAATTGSPAPAADTRSTWRRTPTGASEYRPKKSSAQALLFYPLFF